MRILVTGGAGFIGSHYVRSVLLDSWNVGSVQRVIVLDKLTYAGNLENLSPIANDPRYSFVQGDIADPRAVSSVMSEVDVVVNFAAESHVDRSIADATDFIATNIRGTQVLLDTALGNGVEKFVHISTDEVYGSIASGHATEENPLWPNSPYAASKAAADLLVRSYVQTHGLPAVVTRSSNNYGPYQFPEKFIPLAITHLMRGEPIPLYGDGLNIRDWIHVDDNCRGIHLAALRGQPGKIYNIGAGNEFTNRQVLNYLLPEFNADWSAVEFVTDRPGHDRRYAMDSTKIQQDLGFSPQWSFEDGIKHTVEWYQQNSSWWQ